MPEIITQKHHGGECPSQRRFLLFDVWASDRFAALLRGILCFLLIIYSIYAPRMAYSQDSIKLGQHPAVVLKRIGDVYNLTSEKLAHGYSIQFRGVVTYNDPKWNIFFCQDGDSSIYLPYFKDQLQASVGDRVEITTCIFGSPTNLAFTNTTLRLLEHGKLPEPRRGPVVQLLSGSIPVTYVELEGQLRNIIHDDRVYLVLLIDGKRYRALVLNPDINSISQMVGSTIRIDGVRSGKPLDEAYTRARPTDLLVNTSVQISFLKKVQKVSVFDKNEGEN